MSSLQCYYPRQTAGSLKHCTGHTSILISLHLPIDVLGVQMPKEVNALSIKVIHLPVFYVETSANLRINHSFKTKCYVQIFNLHCMNHVVFGWQRAPRSSSGTQLAYPRRSWLGLGPLGPQTPSRDLRSSLDVGAATDVRATAVTFGGLYVEVDKLEGAGSDF